MKKLLVMDAQNYDTALPEIYRISVRGIIFVQGKLLLIRSRLGDVKFPGGGQEKEETDFDTLIRETLEETGYHVIVESIREFGEVEEIRLSTKEPMIWHQINRYYFCNVRENKEECHYTEHEKKYNFHPIWCTLDEAMQINQEMLNKKGKPAWNEREFNVLRLLKESMKKDFS